MDIIFSDKGKAFSSKRLALMLLALLTSFAAVSLVWNIIQHKNNTLDLALIHAKTVLEKDMLFFRRWNSLLGEVYAPVSGKTEPNPYLEGVVTERDIKTPSGRELTFINHAYMMHQVFELGEIDNDVLGRISSLKPINPENATDPWEREALIAFEKGAKEVSSISMLNGREYMRLIRPIVTEEECLKCHTKQGYRQGDIRGGISVSVPMEPHRAALSRSFNLVLFGHIFLWFCGVGAVYTVYRLKRRAEYYQKEAEDKLRDAAEEWRSTFDSITDLVSVHDTEFRILKCNRAFADFLKKKPEELIGRHCYDAVHGLSKPFQGCPHVEMMKSGNTETKEIFNTRYGLHLMVTVSPIFENGKLKGSVHYIKNITERKKAEEALSREYQFKSAVLQGASEGLCVCHEIPEFPFVHFTIWNNKMKEITGYTVEEINRSGWYQTVYPDPEIRSLAIERMQRMRMGDDMKNEEWEITRSDGVKRFISISTSIITVANDEHHVLAIMTDITDQKRAEKELLESSQFTKQVIESAQEGIVVYDKDLKHIVWNPFMEKLTGLSPADVLGKHPIEIFPFMRESGLINSMEKALRGEIIETNRIYFHIPKTGLSGWTSNVSAPLINAQGEVIGVIATVRDITEHVQAEEQLRHSQKMDAIGTLAGGIAHDFNNILNVIIGYSNMVRDSLKTDSPSREHMDEVLAAAEKAANLTKKLMTFSRKDVADLKPININETIVNFQKMLGRIIKENIALHLDLADKPLIVIADSGSIEQVLMNLASNARHAMPKGGRLTIGTGIQEIDNAYIALNGYGKPGMYTLITVADTGHGIDAETQKKIFEPFFTTKGVGEGTGLGLSISYGIIKQHNGYMKVYSEPGQGTVFKIYLPLSEGPVSLGKTEAPDALKGGNETILVAEDDASLRDLARIVLESFGYSVITAENGEDAVTKFMENKDVINFAILDMIMPKKNGKEVYEEIRKTTPGIKALFTSGYTMDIVNKQELLESGFGFIHKPFLPKDLLRKVREMLDRGEKQNG